MVRFSDMLGGSDDAKAAPATTVPLDAIADEIPEPEDEPEAPAEEPEAPADDEPAPPANASPQEVLDRLTQYAAEHVATTEPPPSPPPPPAPPEPGRLEPAGDDLLPRSKRGRRS